MMGLGDSITNPRQSFGPRLGFVFGRKRKIENHLIFLKSQ